MTRLVPPAPVGATTWQEYAARLRDYLLLKDRSSQAVQLDYITPTTKVGPDGFMMFDKASGKVAVSVGGVWKFLQFEA